VLALAVLAGHPQMAYYGMMMVAGVTVWLLGTRWYACGFQSIVSPVIGLAVAGLGGLLLASIHLLPLLEFTKNSTRQDAVAATDAYPLVQVIKALFGHTPPSAVPWENVMQPGGLVLLLAAIGVIAAGRRMLPLLGGIVLIGVLAMGNASPLFDLAARVLPEFDGFRGLSRIWLVALLGIALLAGIGAEALLGLMHSYHPRYLRRNQLMLGFVMLLLVSITLIKVDQGRAQVRVVTASTPSPLERTVAQLAGTSRSYGVQRNLPQLGAVTLNLRMADGWDPLLIENFVKFMSKAGGYKIEGYQLTIPPVDDGKPNAKLLGLMHVGIVVSNKRLTDPGLLDIKTVGKVQISRNADDAGPAYLVKPAANGAPPTLDELQRLPGGVTPTRLSRENDQFEATTNEPAYLVVADPAYPGWQATVDGKRANIEQIDGILPAIKLTPGTHTIVYHYAPSSVKLGALLALAGLVLTFGGLLFGWMRIADRRGRASSDWSSP
ncbi:MAG TPA: YfhO family protein, partial [Nitrolancea sp.]|nr:YfhO family protein [Nitrolancea sp.]